MKKILALEKEYLEVYDTITVKEFLKLKGIDSKKKVIQLLK